MASLTALACTGIGPVPPPAESSPDDTYVIGVTDSLLINVWKNPELSLTVPVRSDGKISIPLLDDVQAAGLTPEELKEVISESLAEFVSAPDVTVVVMGMNSRTVAVIGGVARSGSVVPLQRDMRVLEAIATLGGFSTWAKRDRVRVLRRRPEGLVEYRFNYGAYLAGKAPDSNFLLEPGDTIVVPD